MKTKTERILAAINVVTWIAFIGLCIQSGAILVSYGVSVVNPEAAKHLYPGLYLYNLAQFDFGHYTLIVFFKATVYGLEAYVAYLLIKILSTIKLSNPFTMDIALRLEKISYFLFGTWVIAMFYDLHMAWLAERVTGLDKNYISGEFIFMAGVVFVISQIFKKGVEIQSENELTV
jgi:hypothetical protein